MWCPTGSGTEPSSAHSGVRANEVLVVQKPLSAALSSSEVQSQQSAPFFFSSVQYLFGQL